MSHDTIHALEERMNKRFAEQDQRIASLEDPPANVLTSAQLKPDTTQQFPYEPTGPVTAPEGSNKQAPVPDSYGPGAVVRWVNHDFTVDDWNQPTGVIFVHMTEAAGGTDNPRFPFLWDQWNADLAQPNITLVTAAPGV